MMPELQIYENHMFPSDLNWQAVSFARIEFPKIGAGRLRQMFPAELNLVHVVVVKDGLLLSYAGVIQTRFEHIRPGMTAAREQCFVSWLSFWPGVLQMLF